MLEHRACVPNQALFARLAKLLVFCGVLGAAPATLFAQNGTVNGTVTRAANGAGLAGGSVRFCRTPSQCFSATTNASGGYSISLVPGTYFAFTEVVIDDLVNEIYDDIKCVDFCNSTSATQNGTPIQVVTGGTLTRNFALSAGGAFSGVVTDAVSGAPLAGIGVQVWTGFPGVRNVFSGFETTTTNAAGAYSVDGLPTGVYFANTFPGSGPALSTAAPLGHAHELFDNILCANCTLIASGTEIPVTIGAVTPGINFALAPGGRITGRVRRADTLAPIPDVFVFAHALLGQTVRVANAARTDASGNYALPNLPTGSYFLSTSTSEAINEVHPNVSCEFFCSEADVPRGTPIGVTQGATTSGQDFLLDGGGLIFGAVLTAGTMSPLNTSVQIYRQVGAEAENVRFASTDSAGNYVVRGLPTGSYFAVAGSSGRVREVYDGLPCSPCEGTQILAGKPIPVVVTGATVNINFALDLGVSVTGTITDAATAAPIDQASVSVYRAGLNTPVATEFTNSAGSFVVSGLPPGAYFAAASANQFASEVFNNRVCAGTCSPVEIFAGNAFGGIGGATVMNINFALDSRPTVPSPPRGLSAAPSAGGVTFTWLAPTSGGAATSYVLEAGLSPGATVIALPSATTSLTVPGVPPGTFFVRVRGVNAVGAGSPSTEYVLTANAGGIVPDPPRFLVASTSAGRLTVTWAAPNLGPVDSYVLEAGTATGLANVAVINLATRSFVFDPVPSGFFFIRVRTRAGPNLSAPSNEMMINPGGVPAPPSPPQSFTVGVTGTTVSFNWEAPLLGTAANYILEAGTASGLSNITTFNTGSAATALVVPGVPPGTYFVRLRAANALGVSPVSNELVVVVSP